MQAKTHHVSSAMQVYCFTKFTASLAEAYFDF